MDSQAAIISLKALLSTFTDEAKGAQGRVDALTTAITLLENGYQTDQNRIDTSIQSGKDAVAAQVADLIDSGAQKEDILAVLTPVDTPMDAN